MHNFFHLLRFKLKNLYINPMRQLVREKGGVLKLIGFSALMILAFLPIVIMYGVSTWEMGPILKLSGELELILTMGITIAEIAILFFSIHGIGSEFYYTKESDMLMTLPFKAEETFLAKFVALYVGEIIFSVFVILPAVLSYGRVMDVGVLYYIGGIFVALTAPILPMAFLLLLTTLLMRVTSRSTGKTLTQTLSFLFILGLAIGMQFVSHDVGEKGFEMMVTTGALSRLRTPAKIFFTSYLSTEMLRGSWLMGLALIASYAVIFFVLAWFARTMYYTTLMNNKSESTKKAKITGESYRRSGQVATIFKKDWMRTVRTPIFLASTLASAFLFALIFIIPTVRGLKSASDGVTFASMLDGVQNFSQENPWLIRIVPGFALGAIFGFTSGSTCILFSREGKSYWIHRVLPIDPKNEACARYLYGLSVVAVPILILLLLFSAFVWFDPILIALSILLATVTVTPSILASLYTDLSKPDLSWEDPAKMGKRNFRQVLVVYASIAAYLALGLLFYFVYRSFGVFLSAGLILLILLMISFVFAQRLVVKLREGMDL